MLGMLAYLKNMYHIVATYLHLYKLNAFVFQYPKILAGDGTSQNRNSYLNMCDIKSISSKTLYLNIMSKTVVNSQLVNKYLSILNNASYIHINPDIWLSIMFVSKFGERSVSERTTFLLAHIYISLMFDHHQF